MNKMNNRLRKLEHRVRRQILVEERRWLAAATDAELRAVVESGDPESTARLQAATDAQLQQLIDEVEILYLAGGSPAAVEAQAREIMEAWR